MKKAIFFLACVLSLASSYAQELQFKNNKAYFADKKGNKIAKLGEWDKADSSGFFVQIDKFAGFARVQKDQKDYLLDTLGNAYRAAYNLKDLNPDIKALDLSGTQLDSFPKEILVHSQLEVLIFRNYGGYGTGGTLLGTLPAQIGNLKNLRVLKLPSCGLDSLPTQIGELKNLARLDLSFNSITKLPTSIGQLLNLKYLDITHTKIEYLPETIGNLANLEYLIVSASALFNPTGIGAAMLKKLPKSLVKLKKLKHLDISDNPLDWQQAISILAKMPQKMMFATTYDSLRNFKGLEVRVENEELFYALLTNAQLGKFKSTTSISLSEYTSTTLPKRIAELSELEEISISYGGIFTLPEELKNLKKLKTISISYCPLIYLPKSLKTFLKGKINFTERQLDTLYNPEKTRSLDFRYYQGSKLPAQISQLKNLEILVLDGRNQNLDWKDALATLSALNKKIQFTTEDKTPQKGVLWIKIANRDWFNILEIASSAQITELKNLTELSVDSKSVPKKIEELTNLTVLNLGSSKLTTLPIQIGKLKKMTSLYLGFNELTGLPAEIGQLTNLTVLDLTNNKIIKLPSQIAELKKITLLDLSFNDKLDW